MHPEPSARHPSSRSTGSASNKRSPEPHAHPTVVGCRHPCPESRRSSTECLSTPASPARGGYPCCRVSARRPQFLPSLASTLQNHHPRLLEAHDLLQPVLFAQHLRIAEHRSRHRSLPGIVPVPDMPSRSFIRVLPIRLHHCLLPLPSSPSSCAKRSNVASRS